MRDVIIFSGRRWRTWFMSTAGRIIPFFWIRTHLLCSDISRLRMRSSGQRALIRLLTVSGGILWRISWKPTRITARLVLIWRMCFIWIDKERKVLAWGWGLLFIFYRGVPGLRKPNKIKGFYSMYDNIISLLILVLTFIP